MTTRLGPVQRQVLLCLSDGDSYSAARVDLDMMMAPGQAYGALQGLWRRGLVERGWSHNDIEWHLTRKGSELADEMFGEDAP